MERLGDRDGVDRRAGQPALLGRGCAVRDTVVRSGVGKLLRAHVCRNDALEAVGKGDGRLNAPLPDVVAGADYVFQRAQGMGRPAVLNMSLGGHFSAHDGTSLYEQALSGLTGPGRIIVAAAGNDGFNSVHAGENVPPTVENETLVLPNRPDFAGALMWYDAGTMNQFAIAAYSVTGGQLNFLGG